MRYSSIDVVDRFKFFDLQKDLERHKLVLQVLLFTLFTSEICMNCSLGTYIEYSPRPDLYESLACFYDLGRTMSVSRKVMTMEIEAYVCIIIPLNSRF